MSPELLDAMGQARHQLANARAILNAHVPEVAGREAYLAAYHAALAFVFARTGKVAKTHSGVRTNFALAVRDMPDMVGFARFLAEGYEIKILADYGHARRGPVSMEEAQTAIATAARMLDSIEAMLGGA